MAADTKVTVASIVKKITKQTDIALALGVMFILIIMIIPIPSILLDFFLTVSISLSIIILLVSLYAERPLDFSSFPFVLLLTTLFRLSLNVSTTRTILLHGHEGPDAAGEIIRAFGQFVVGGNYAVGIIVFIILVLINFMVITKGSGRVAEVAARFTLDAMPGKQMAIDADLNAGIINEDEARKRREDVRREADFYGSMDGASKFVRGDAVAGLIITAINIIGGLVLGMLQHGLPIAEAASTYTILTIGDGLVGQIPALIISTSAGIIVTRAGNDSGSLAKQLTKQLFPQARVLFITGGLLLFFAIVPGMPKLAFIFLGLVAVGVGYLMQRKEKKGDTLDDEESSENEEEKPPAHEEEEVKELLEMDTMELEIGFGIIPLVDAAQGGTLLNRIKSIRRQIALEMGFIVPPVRIRDNLQLDADEYVVLLRGVRTAKGNVMPDRYMAMNPAGPMDDINGIPTKEPAFGLPAKWVDEVEKEKAEIAGYTIVDPATIIATHLTEVIKKNSAELLGRQETQDLLDKLKEKHPKIVEDVVPGILDLSTLNRVLQNLLKERVSIRNLQTILEALATYGTMNKDIEYLTEKVRFALRKQITESLLAQDGKLYVFALPQPIEQLIIKNMHPSDEGKEIVIDPATARKILTGLMDKTEEVTAKGIPPVLFVSQPIRFAMRRFVEKYSPSLNIIAHTEVADNVQIDSLGTVLIKNDDNKGQ